MLLTLSNFIVQPPGDEDETEPGDPGNKDFEPKGQPPGTQQPPPPPPQQQTNPVWGGTIPDTGRGDSLAWHQEDKIIGLDSLPEGAAVEKEDKPVAGAPLAVKTRRGVLGVHPLALLLGLVAFHVFIVTTAGK